MDRHDPNEKDIRARIATYLKTKGYTTVKVDDCVHGVLTILNDYGKHLGILNASGTCRDSQKLDTLIGHYVDIRAIAQHDRVARQWVQAECDNVVRKVRDGSTISLDSQALEKVVAEARQRVHTIAEGGVGEPEWPMDPQELIKDVVSDSLRRELEKQGRPVPAVIAQYGEGQQPKCQALTEMKEAQELVHTGISHLLEDYCLCIKQAVLELNRAPGQLLALAYPYGKRRPSTEVAPTLRVLTNKKVPVDSVDSNLSTYTKILRNNVQAQFVARIGRLMEGAEGRQRPDRFFQRLCRTFLRDPPRDVDDREKFCTQLGTLEADPLAIDVTASVFCTSYLPATGLEPQDRNFLENIVRLSLAVNHQDHNRVEAICGDICRMGIPDRRERLLHPGVQALGRALCAAPGA